MSQDGPSLGVVSDVMAQYLWVAAFTFYNPGQSSLQIEKTLEDKTERFFSLQGCAIFTSA